MIPFSEYDLAQAVRTSEEIVREGRDRKNFYFSENIRTMEKQKTDWEIGVLGEIAFRKWLKRHNSDCTLKLSVLDEGHDGGTDVDFVCIEGEGRHVKIDVKTVQKGHWLLVDEKRFSPDVTYVLMRVSRPESNKNIVCWEFGGVGSGWMFLDNNSKPFFGFRHGDLLFDPILAANEYKKKLSIWRQKLSADFIKTTNIGKIPGSTLDARFNYGLPQKALLQRFGNVAELFLSEGCI